LLSYDDKYNSENGKTKGMASATRKIPADLNPEIEKKIQLMAKLAYEPSIARVSKNRFYV